MPTSLQKLSKVHNGSMHLYCNICRQRHHDIVRRHRLAQVHQATSIVETPLRHATQSPHRRRSRRKSLCLIAPPANTHEGEQRRMPPSADPTDPDLGLPPELTRLGDEIDCNKEDPR
jgi:hypothetical protein